MPNIKMKYLEWNNGIAHYFFNDEKAGQDVNLYVTKKDIISIGKSISAETSDELIWRDFILTVKTGLPGSKYKGDIIEKATHSFEQWKRPGLKSIEEIDISFPCYLIYLIFFILPLTEETFEFHAKDYYGPLKAFLEANNISQKIDSLHDLDALWIDLEKWSIIKENGNKGYFTLGKFSSTYKYVGKPYSQCVFSPTAIKKLPLLFSKAGMIPDLLYTSEEIKKSLLQFGTTILGLKKGKLEIIKKFETNEIGRAIIEIVKREYSNWNGESHESISQSSSRLKRNFTYSRLYLQFKINDNNGNLVFSYRIRSSNVFPEDLKFGDLENIHDKGVWSRTLLIPFQISFEIKDAFNKWIARFVDRDIRLFINGSVHDFNTSYWIETDSLIKTDWMFLLCKDSVKLSVIEWGAHFIDGQFLEVTLKNIPANYSLFKFYNPSKSHETIQILQFNPTKSVQLVNALQFDHRIYTNDYIPEVEITNADGTEIVSIEYKCNGETICLTKNSVKGNRWALPENIKLDEDFCVKMKGQAFVGYQKSYKVISSKKSAQNVDGKFLAKRDSFGRKTALDLNQYCFGSNIVNPDRRSQRYHSPWEVLYLSLNTQVQEQVYIPEYVNHEGNVLLSFLSLKKCCTAQDFFSVFEFLYNMKYGAEREDTSINYSRIRKTALNFYDYLGYLDYDYESNEIVVNSPQFIFIPAKQGRKVLLIGARDEGLVREIIDASSKHNLQVEIMPQFSKNAYFLLPDAIIIKAFGTAKTSYGETDLKALANELKINFNENHFSQLGLQHFSTDINLYEQDMAANNRVLQNDWDWAPYIFNPESLTLNMSLNKDFDKSYTLAEYRLRPWEYYHLLWINNECFSVDKNWGRFLVLKHFNQQVILFDKIKDKVAIPYYLPLPRLLAESILTLSGLAPVTKKIDGLLYRIYDNIPGIFTENLFNKLGQIPQPKDL